jgi:hypothetical protein
MSEVETAMLPRSAIISQVETRMGVVIDAPTDLEELPKAILTIAALGHVVVRFSRGQLTPILLPHRVAVKLRVRIRVGYRHLILKIPTFHSLSLVPDLWRRQQSTYN